jgi:peptidoglycan/LPS O-acetylase OafA/YrhL
LPIPGINLGKVGVNLFFVLSGWLMTRLLFIQRTPIDVFYRRRIARIVPAHLAFIAAVCLMWVCQRRSIDLTETIAALLFINNYVVPAGERVMPFGHIWSLSVEEHSYILLSALALGARRYTLPAPTLVGGAALVCAISAAGYAAFYPADTLRYKQWYHTEVAAWGIFSSSFLLLVFRNHSLPRWVGMMVPMLAALGVVLHWWSIPPLIQQIVGVGALALAVNLLPQAPAWVRNALAARPLRLLGLWSFSLYLWQQPFHLTDLPAPVALCGVFAAGLTSYYLLEQPARRYLNRHWGHIGPAAPMAVTDHSGKGQG